jgi:hypothetical protein
MLVRVTPPVYFRVAVGCVGLSNDLGDGSPRGMAVLKSRLLWQPLTAMSMSKGSFGEIRDSHTVGEWGSAFESREGYSCW